MADQRPPRQIAVLTRRLEQATWLMAEVDHRRDYWAAQRHPFYERWAAGALTGAELQAYAAEHHHVAVAAAEVTRHAAALAEGLLHDELARQAKEREHDVASWCAFAVGTGWDPGSAWYYAAEPLPETEAAVAVWLGGPERSLAEHLVTLYALEAAQSDVARPALDALLGSYGFSGDRAVRYFELRLQGDAGPAGVIEAALTGRLPVADPFALVHRAELTVRAYWGLLDGVARSVSDGGRGHSPADLDSSGSLPDQSV